MLLAVKRVMSTNLLVLQAGGEKLPPPAGAPFGARGGREEEEKGADAAEGARPFSGAPWRRLRRAIK